MGPHTWHLTKKVRPPIPGTARGPRAKDHALVNCRSRSSIVKMVTLVTLVTLGGTMTNTAAGVALPPKNL